MVSAIQLHPSYSQGFARYAGSSAYPNFWKELRGAWVPGIESGGLSDLQNLAGRGYAGVQTNIVGADWVVGHGGYNGYALDIESTDTIKVPAGFLTDNFGDLGDGPLTMSVFFKPTANVTYCPVIDSANRHLVLAYSVGSPESAAGYISIGGGQGTRDMDLIINEWSLITVVKKIAGANPTQFGYVNGIETFSSVVSGTSFSDELEIGGNPGGGLNINSRTIGAVYIWRRALTVEEIGDLSDDPFLPFRSRVNRVFEVPGVAAGGLPAGSLALMGVGI